VITGGTGLDTNILSGGEERTTLTGGAGADTLNGDGGGRQPHRRGGRRHYDGGPRNDTFRFAAGFGNDIIAGFDANPGGGGQDLLDIASSGSRRPTSPSSRYPGYRGSTLVTVDGVNSLL